MSTPAQRALDFLGGQPATPPVCLQTYLSLYLEPHRRAGLVAVYRELLGGERERTLDFDERIEAELDAWDRAWSVLARPPAWMPARWSPVSRGQLTRIAERDGRIVAGPDGGALVDVIDAPQGSTTDVWDRREPGRPLDPATLAPAGDAQAMIDGGAAEYARRAQARWGDRHLLCGAMGSPFWLAYSALGFAGLMESLRTEPELLGQIIGRRTEALCATAEVWAAAGLSCVFLEETLSSSDLISVADYLRFSWPTVRAVLQHARDLGLRTVYYYCGGIEGRVEHLARLPADALAFEESKKSFVIDLAEIRQVVGPERPLLGNIDAVLLRGAEPATIERAVREQWEAAGPLLATSCGSPLTLDTPAWKLDALVESTQALPPRD